MLPTFFPERIGGSLDGEQAPNHDYWQHAPNWLPKGVVILERVDDQSFIKKEQHWLSIRQIQEPYQAFVGSPQLAVRGALT
jgi:hypothetical protein